MAILTSWLLVAAVCVSADDTTIRAQQRGTPSPRIQATPIPMTVARIDGKVLSLHAGPGEKEPGYVAIAGSPLKLAACGTVDVIYNETAVLLHERPGECRELLFTPEHPESGRSVAWDGELIWISNVADGLRVIRPDGSTITTIDRNIGLPTFSTAVLLQPVGPRRVLAAGADEGARAWVAELSIVRDRPVVRVIHEAPVPHSAARTEKQNQLDPKLAFVPSGVHLVRDALDGGRPFVLLERGDLRFWPLRIDQADRSVDVMEIGPINLAAGLRFRSFHPLTNGDAILMSDSADEITWLGGFGRLADGGSAVRKLFGQPEVKLAGPMIEYNGYVYVPGSEWVRINPESLEVERLGQGPLSPLDSDSSADWGVSAHFGMVAWNGEFKFWAVNLVEPKKSDAVQVELVRVIDASTSTPLMNAEIVVRQATNTHVVRTARDGTSAVRFDASPGAGVQVDVHAEDYWSRGVSVTRARDGLSGGLLTIELSPTVHIGGRVVDDQGEPISGKQVQIDLRGDRAESGMRTDPIAILDAEGRWRAVLPPVNLRRLSLVLAESPLAAQGAGLPLSAPGAHVNFDASTPDEVLNALRNGEYEWVVNRSGVADEPTLYVWKVIDENEQPVSKGSGEIHRGDGTDPIPVAIEGGTLTIKSDLVPADSVLIVRAAGRAPFITTVEALRDAESITLGPAQSLEIRTLSKKSEPMADVRVTFVFNGITLFDDKSKASGIVRWADAPAPDAALTVEKPGWIARERPIDPARRNRRVFELELRVTRSIELHVLDASTREPIPQSAYYRPNSMAAILDGKCKFELANDESIEVTIRAKGYIAQSVIVDGANDRDVEVLLVPAPAITGVLRTPGGQVLKNVELGQWRDEWGQIPLGVLESNRLAVTARTDDDGYFSFEPIAGPSRIFFFGPEGYGVADTDSVLRTGELVVFPGCRIEGVLPPDSGNGAGEEIEWIAPPARKREVPSVRVRLTATTRIGGRFVFESVPPIEGWISHRIVAGGRPRDVGPEGAVQHARPMLISPQSGQTLTIELLPAGRAVIGQIGPFTRSNEREITKVKLVPEGPLAGRMPNAPGSVICADDGTFRFADVAPGEYELSVQWIHQTGSPKRRAPFTVLVRAGDGSEPEDLGKISVHQTGPAEPGKRGPSKGESGALSGQSLIVQTIILISAALWHSAPHRRRFGERA